MPFLAAPIVAAIGLTGTSALVGTFLLQVGIGVGLSLLARSLAKPKTPRFDQTVRQQGFELSLSTDAAYPRTLVLGERGIAGSLAYFCVSGPENNDLDLIIALADHEIEGVTGVWVDGKPISWSPNALGYQDVAEFNNKMSIRVYRGTDDQVAQEIVQAASGGQWTTAHRLRGVAYAWVRLVWDPDVWRGGGIPNILFKVKGAKLYDPRKDSTVPGGSGAHRWGDPSTYEWTDNLEVARYNYLRGIAYVDGRHRFGVGLGAEDIDLSAAIAAMNVCDEVVGLRTGGSEFRYRISAAIAADEPFRAVLERMSIACAGSIPDLSGRYAMYPGAPQVPVIGFTDADLVAGAELTGSRHRSLGEVVNELTGEWADPLALYQRVAVPARRSSADEAEDGGFRRTESYDLDYVGSGTQGQRVLEIFRRLGRRQRTHKLTLRRRFSVLEAGDWVTWTSDVFGYNQAVFRVEAVTLNADWTVTLDLREIDSDVYAWTPATDELDPAAPADLPNAGPDLVTVSQFAVATAEVLGGDGTRLPALRATWTAIADASVVGMRIDYRRVGDTPWLTYNVPVDQVRAGAATITAGVTAGAIYEARATLVTNPPRVVQTTAPVAAGSSTPTMIVHDALVSTVTEDVRPGIITFDDLDGRFRGAFDESLLDNLDRIIISRLGAEARLADISTAFSRSDAQLRADVALGLNPISAGIERIDQVQAELQSAIAATQTTLEAQISGVAADLQTEESARASGDQALSTQFDALSAQVGADIAGIETQIAAQATSTGLLASDTSRLYVQDSEIADLETLSALIAEGRADEIDLESIRRTNQATASVESFRVATIENGTAIAALGARLDAEVADRQAAVTQEAQARADAISALASDVTTVEAKADGISASGQVGIVAIAGQDGAAASYQVTLRAGENEGGWRLDALSDGGVRVIFDADSFQIRSPGFAGGLPFPLFTADDTGFTMNGNVRVNGNLLVTGSVEATRLAAGLSSLQETSGTVSLSGGSSPWRNLGPPISITIADRGGFGFPLILIRAVGTAQVSNAGTVSSRFRVLLNGQNVYEAELFNTFVEENRGAAERINDFIARTSAGDTHVFQIQYQHNYVAGSFGSLFAKIGVLMIAR